MLCATFAQFRHAFNAQRRGIIAADFITADARRHELSCWLAGIDGLDPATLEPASEDASFRRYFRVASRDSTYIVMDAPPEHEECRPFIRVAAFLQQMHLNSPRVISTDSEKGFLLLTDLGSTLYLTELRNDRSHADRLYADAITALLTMQSLGRQFQSDLPPYDEALLSFELSLFHDWLCMKHLGLTFSASEESHWRDCCELLIDNARQQRKVFVHRDYHSRNLMVTRNNNPGILDFQDAVEGPLTYDLVSLLKDCYIRWPDEKVRGWALQYYRQLDDELIDELDPDRFLRYFDLMGVQRHLKASGIFARLLHRDGKAGFMRDVPRTLSYVESLQSEYDELSFLTDLIGQRVLPELGQLG